MEQTNTRSLRSDNVYAFESSLDKTPYYVDFGSDATDSNGILLWGGKYKDIAMIRLKSGHYTTSDKNVSLERIGSESMNLISGQDTLRLIQVSPITRTYTSGSNTLYITYFERGDRKLARFTGSGFSDDGMIIEQHQDNVFRQGSVAWRRTAQGGQLTFGEDSLLYERVD